MEVNVELQVVVTSNVQRGAIFVFSLTIMNSSIILEHNLATTSIFHKKAIVEDINLPKPKTFSI
jgi:hypothetical protein